MYKPKLQHSAFYLLRVNLDIISRCDNLVRVKIRGIKSSLPTNILGSLSPALLSKRKNKPISNIFKIFFQVLWRGLRTLLSGENFRRIPGKIHSLQLYAISFLKRKFIARKLLAFFREYAATIVVAFCVILVALINLASSKDYSGSFFGALAGKNNGNQILKNKISIQKERKGNLATAPLTGPGYLTDPASSVAEYYAENDRAYLDVVPSAQSQIMLADYNPVSAKNGRQAQTYQVREGDTPSLIAAKYGISASTVLAANNLSETSLIKPGDKLAILPVTGIKYKVQKGDSLNAIVSKYNTDKQRVMAYNEIPADEKLKEGQEIILPDAYISPPAGPATGTRLAIAGQAQSYSSVSGYAPIRLSGGGSGHRFPYGYCTWYVSQRRYVPWGGNAGAWLANARASGKATGRTPRPGAIVVTGESRWGHVALVESVSGSSFTVSEMNYAGFGKKSKRIISTNSRAVKGFIY